ncbi:MAG TPA: citramalate synthase [Dehalococcoidales bacterium]|nr:citramalate synthase [Dehalococcoidales bacterium]
MSKVQLYDTTLRDGSQREGISISVTDRLEIARKLDMLGIHYIEGGWPGANPRDAEFFIRARDLKLKQAKIVVFGSTRRAGTRCEDDDNLKAILDSGAKVATIVGKTSIRHVTHVLECTPEENLAMIADSIRFLKAHGLVVFLDAEHFFDGTKINVDYSLKCLKVAAEAGAACNVLCDTNGGTLPDEIAAAVKLARKTTNITLGIHAHNDAELAVANTLAAVTAGAIQVQGTINGYGERSGNANLCSIIPDLKLKMGIDCISDEQLTLLSEVSHFVSEAANMALDNALPYVGASAFAHKAGYHVSGISKWADAYQHIDPAKVGAKPHAVISDLSGKSNIINKAKERGLKLPAKGEEARKLAARIKFLESRGFQYDNAEASFDLLVHRAAPDYKPPFELVDFMVVVENRRRPSIKHEGSEVLAEAMVKLKVGDKILHTAAEGNGPVNALDQALRTALLQFYPDISRLKLTDYKVRILEESTGTESQVRVLIQSSDGNEEWRTVGSSVNIIEASWLALSDAVEYWLLKNKS